MFFLPAVLYAQGDCASNILEMPVSVFMFSGFLDKKVAHLELTNPDIT